MEFFKWIIVLVGQEQTDRGRRLMAGTGKIEMKANGRSSEMYSSTFLGYIAMNKWKKKNKDI